MNQSSEEVGIISFVYIDPERDELVTLMNYVFRSRDQLERYWSKVEPADEPSMFMADLDCGDGLEGNVEVSPKFIEEVTGENIDMLIASGRERNAETRRRLCGRIAE